MSKPAGEPRSDAEIKEVALSAMSVPLLRLLEAELVDERDPRAGTHVAVGGDALNAVDTLHAGAIATLLETTAYLALLPDLGSGEQAATHAFSASYLRAGRRGDDLICTAKVTHRSGRLAFVEAQLARDGELLATATVTKSIIRAS